jgi:hypothetical protein
MLLQFKQDGSKWFICKPKANLRKNINPLKPNTYKLSKNNVADSGKRQKQEVKGRWAAILSCFQCSLTRQIALFIPEGPNVGEACLCYLE